MSWRVARDLRAHGHDAIHIADLGLAAADDRVVYVRAVSENRTLLTQDSDFGSIHASSTARVGVVLLRLSEGRPSTHSAVIQSNLEAIEAVLGRGGFVVIEDALIRVSEPIE